MGKINELYKKYLDSNKTDNEFIKFVIDPNNLKSLNDKDEYGQTVLHAAAYDDDVKTVKLLLSRKADVHATDKHGNTPLWNCMNIVPDINMEIVRLLIAAGADINEADKIGLTTLDSAVGATNIKKTIHLLALGANINKKTRDNKTPLQLALRLFALSSDNIKNIKKPRDNETSPELELAKEMKKNREEILKLLFKKERVICQDFTDKDFEHPDIPPRLTDGVIMIGCTILQGEPPISVPITRKMKGFENAITNPQEFKDAAAKHQFNFRPLELAVKYLISPEIIAFKEILKQIKAQQSKSVPSLTHSLASSMAKLMLSAKTEEERISVEKQFQQLPSDLQELVEEEENYLTIEINESEIKKSP